MDLENKTGRMRTYVLAHEDVCDSACYCVQKIHLQTLLDPKTGNQGVREVPLSVPMSIHIPARGVAKDVPASAVRCKQIASDLDNGLLVVKGN